jgi:hypothetical protein
MEKEEEGGKDHLGEPAEAKHGFLKIANRGKDETKAGRAIIWPPRCGSDRAWSHY